LEQTKILLIDIETTPIGGWVWQMYDTSVLRVFQYPYILCYAYKWYGEKKTKVVALPDFTLYKKEPKNDFALVKSIHELFDQAHMVLGHNGNEFDNKWIYKEFIRHDFSPPSPAIWIDTLKIAKKYFRFDGNSLDQLARFFGVGRKLPHQGLDTWFDAMDGKLGAWKIMKKYNKHDVELLDEVYTRMRPYAQNHPNVNIIPGRLGACPKCGSLNLRVHKKDRPTAVGFKTQYQCFDCGGYSTGKPQKIKGMEIR
jgi:DNA polymerase III epsilon subunit-like protein